MGSPIAALLAKLLLGQIINMNCAVNTLSLSKRYAKHAAHMKQETQNFNPEDVDSMFLRNVGIYTAS
jgi:hypothetical protein